MGSNNKSPECQFRNQITLGTKYKLSVWECHELTFDVSESATKTIYSLIKPSRKLQQ